jgi:hypothetical protein
MKQYLLFFLTAMALVNASCGMAQSKNSKYPDPPVVDHKAKFPMQFDEATWKQRLTTGTILHPAAGRNRKVFYRKYDHFYEKELITLLHPFSRYSVLKQSLTLARGGQAFTPRSTRMQ